ncbi:MULTISPECIES: hypothetical protein [unclassified Lysobacter]|uniref:hypothetical protein n=1 Tax=unclassified Lysobacter TaxID=2635362 RepID=UPI001BE78955|nr:MULTISPECIES: hypothetical protein [unclassified Lysobacter]MBT2746601.1 hypothetical protein [Lysobacter sp. ISL-42]MBT2753404.1 hypothetical protein [Lysobacter sp. ISL-50]MBT2775514.1 hypothetical protein [Lysobacter sp. ISL-54]MBT2782950.1 hypothetical protein [Lysobacter sp. ISL-52]
MGNDTKQTGPKRDRQGSRDGPPGGQGHQPLPGETPSSDDAKAKRKHVQNADLPPGKGHQPLPGENSRPDD